MTQPAAHGVLARVNVRENGSVRTPMHEYGAEIPSKPAISGGKTNGIPLAERKRLSLRHRHFSCPLPPDENS
jgi:hypothetical protein